jgi:hypothetical protein
VYVVCILLLTFTSLFSCVNNVLLHFLLDFFYSSVFRMWLFIKFAVQLIMRNFVVCFQSYETKRSSPVVSAPFSYSGDPGLNYRPEQRLLNLGFSWVSSVLPCRFFSLIHVISQILSVSLRFYLFLELCLIICCPAYDEYARTVLSDLWHHVVWKRRVGETIALEMEAAGSFNMLEATCKTTWCQSPEDHKPWKLWVLYVFIFLRHFRIFLVIIRLLTFHR